jgi:glycosyltransferase involved in cell wall biosynthesis
MGYNKGRDSAAGKVLKVALVHDWLTGMRGGERCLEAISELFPDAPIYTLLHVPGAVSSTIEKHPIQTSFVQRLPGVRRAYRYYLPLFPRAVESFDLSGYDLIVSTSHCVAKGVRVPSGTCHISYIHTPMRYVWDQYEEYFAKGRTGWLTRSVMGVLRSRLQQWDLNSNDGIHSLIANSRNVAERIRRIYNRQAEVICPPVDFDSFSVSEKDKGFYLMVTAFAPYKRADLAIEVFNQLGMTLKIIGTGQDEDRLMKMAGPTVEFLGWKPDAEVREYYSNCRALVFPGEEDFGIVPLEAMACGKPVIAYAKGGALETIVPLGEEGGDPPTGVLFHRQTPDAMIGAIQRFENHRNRFKPNLIREHVRPFDRASFKKAINRYIQKKWDEFKENLYVKKVR